MVAYVYSLENRFTYHSPHKGQPERYQEIRNKALEFAKFLEAEVPESREQSLAITKIEEAVFWANAGIARNETQIDADARESKP